MDYMTAKTYMNWERIGEPFEEDGKMYTNVKEQCDRCYKGAYITRVNNGIPIPTYVDGGVCYKCGGHGFVVKKVRLYTPEQRAKMDKAADSRKAKVEADRKAKWYVRNGFNEQGITYVYQYDDSYEKKEELKEDGFRFSGMLLWHTPHIAEKYEGKVFAVMASEIYDGEQMIVSEDEVRAMVDRNIIKTKPEEAEDTSEFVGEVGERLRDMKVEYTGMKDTRFSPAYYFEDMDGNTFVWYTEAKVDREIGEVVILSGTVKKHNEWRGHKSTVLNRCRIKEA